MTGETLLSIITPTYNRGKLLNRCFESLVAQSNMNFEWIIIDDGSTDDTEVIVDKIKETNTLFEIKYSKKENGGKHTALNEAHKYINGSYVLILDSDDYLTNDAVDNVLRNWSKYKDNSNIGMVVFLKGESVKEPIAYAKEEHTPVDVLRYKRVCIKGSDCCEVIRTELFLKYPFPVYDGEKFMAETVLWYRVGWEQKCIYINEVIYLCEYLEGGLTKLGRTMRIKNPYGGMLNSELGMDKKNFFKLRIKNGLLFVCYGFFAGFGPREIEGYSKKYRILKAVCMIPGYIMYRKWKGNYLEG